MTQSAVAQGDPIRLGDVICLDRAPSFAQPFAALPQRVARVDRSPLGGAALGSFPGFFDEVCLQGRRYFVRGLQRVVDRPVPCVVVNHEVSISWSGPVKHLPAVRPGVSVHALTSTQHDLIIRPLADRDELGLFCRFPYLLNEELADDLDQGRRQLDWLWMALRGGELLARAAGWKRPEGTGPLLLDIFDIDDGPAGADPADDIEPVDLGVRLLREAMAQVVPPGTRPP